MMRLDVAENSVGSIPSAISTISMPDSHVLPSLQAQAASTLDAAIGCQDENDAADQREEIEESLRKEVSHAGIEPGARPMRSLQSPFPRVREPLSVLKAKSAESSCLGISDPGVTSAVYRP